MNEVTDGIKQAPLRRFRPYREYRDSGVEWLGEIPDHWAVKRLTDLANLVNGFPFDSKSFDRSQGTPLVRIRDLFNTTTEVQWAGAPVPQAEIGNGDILIGMDGDFSVGWWAHGPALLNQRLCSVRALEVRLSQRYLFYSLPFPLSALNDVTYATTVKHVSSLEILKFRLPCPSLDEQRAIATFLDRETAKIDELVARKERLIELLREKRTALITRAVTRGLDPNVPMKDSGVEWLGEIPAHWEVKKLGYVTNIGNGSTPSRNEARYWVDGSHPWLTSAKINEGVISTADQFVTDVALRECHLPGVPAGSALVAITGEGQTRGRAALLSIDSTISQHLAYVTPSCPDVDASFLVRLLEARYDWLRDESSGLGSTRAALTCEFLRSARFAFPPTGEQRAIAALVGCETAKIDTLIAKVKTACSQLGEFRIALISAAVTGKIDVREAASR